MNFPLQIVLFVVLVLPIGVFSDDEKLYSPPSVHAQAPPKSIFLLAGQSNMSGRGGVTQSANSTLAAWDGVVPPECQPSPSISRLAPNNTWQDAHEPLHAGIDPNKHLGVGPGMPFATTLLQLKPTVETVGLVPCAIGGSSLERWNRTSPLYRNLIGRANESTRGGGVIKALLWYQGESDSTDLKSAQTYGKRFDKFVNDLRTDLSSPNLPVIQVALAAAPPRFNYTQLVREQQFGVNLPNVICVDAWGLKLLPDNLHLTTESQVLLGKKMAQAYTTLQY